MARPNIFIAALAALAGAGREIRKTKATPVASTVHFNPPIFRPTASGICWHGATRGTRAAMKRLGLSETDTIRQSVKLGLSVLEKALAA